MEMLGIFAIIVFALGLLCGVLYRQAFKRPKHLPGQDRTKSEEKRHDSAPLDKPPSSG